MRTFTPGPWLRDGRVVYALNAQNFNRFYFSVMDAHTPESELIAVASLAQSAPELLAALEDSLTALNIVYPNGSPVLNAALAAIAKARGQS